MVSSRSRFAIIVTLWWIPFGSCFGLCGDKFTACICNAFVFKARAAFSRVYYMHGLLQLVRIGMWPGLSTSDFESPSAGCTLTWLLATRLRWANLAIRVAWYSNHIASAKLSLLDSALACFSQATSFQSLQSARNITSSSSSPEKGALLANKTANTNPPLSRHLPSKHLSAHLQQIPHHLHHWFHGLHLHLQHAHHLLHVAPPDDKPIEKTVSCLFLRYFFGSRGQIALGLVSISFGRLQVTCEATPPTCLSKRMGLPSIKSPHRQMFAFAALWPLLWKVFLLYRWARSARNNNVHQRNVNGLTMEIQFHAVRLSVWGARVQSQSAWGSKKSCRWGREEREAHEGIAGLQDHVCQTKRLHQVAAMAGYTNEIYPVAQLAQYQNTKDESKPL